MHFIDIAIRNCVDFPKAVSTCPPSKFCGLTDSHTLLLEINFLYARDVSTMFRLVCAVLH